MKNNKQQQVNPISDSVWKSVTDHQVTSLLVNIDTVTNPSNLSYITINYFEEAAALLQGESPNAVTPFHTFSAGTLAFHLNHNATFKLITMNAIADAYRLPDLWCINHPFQVIASPCPGCSELSKFDGHWEGPQQ